MMVMMGRVMLWGDDGGVLGFEGASKLYLMRVVFNDRL